MIKENCEEFLEFTSILNRYLNLFVYAKHLKNTAIKRIPKSQMVKIFSINAKLWKMLGYKNTHHTAFYIISQHLIFYY